MHTQNVYFSKNLTRIDLQVKNKIENINFEIEFIIAYTCSIYALRSSPRGSFWVAVTREMSL